MGQALMDCVPAYMIPVTGYTCAAPFEYEYQSEARFRDCGHCKRCIAKKKRDLAGRAACEAYSAAEVVVWTLTYRDGEAGAKDFVVKDRQDFMKRVRQALYRRARREVGAPKMFRGLSDQDRSIWKAKIAEAQAFVTFFGCGERGEKRTRRCHWHVCMFMSRRSGFVSTPREASGKKGRENHNLWPHGFVNIDVQCGGDVGNMQAIRYVAKYLDKARMPTKAERRQRTPRRALLFRSLRYPLGFKYLTGYARQVAQQGLALHGEYKVPGVQRSSDGRHHKHRVYGVMRGHFIDAYEAEFERLHPGEVPPMTDFLLMFSEHAVFIASPKTKAARMRWRPRGPVLEPLVPVEKRDRSGFLAVAVPGQGFVGMLSMRASGFVEFISKEVFEGANVVHPIPHGNIRDLVKMDDVAHQRVERWIKDKRGPGWMTKREYRAKRLARQIEQIAAVQRFAIDAPVASGRDRLGIRVPMAGIRRNLRLSGVEPMARLLAGLTLGRDGEPVKLRPPKKLCFRGT